MFAEVDFTRVELEVKAGIDQLKDIIFGNLRNLASNDLKSKIQSFEDAFISDCKLYDSQINEEIELKEKENLEIEVAQIQKDIDSLERELNLVEDNCSTTNTIHNSICTVDDEVNSLASKKDEIHNDDAKFYTSAASCFDESFHFEDSESAFEVEEDKKEKTDNVEKEFNQKTCFPSMKYDVCKSSENSMSNFQERITQKAEFINNNQTNSLSRAETMDSEELAEENLFERCAVALISGEFESLDNKAIQPMLKERASNRNISRCDDTDTSFNDVVLENKNTAIFECDKGVTMEITESVGENVNTAFHAQSRSSAGSVIHASKLATTSYESVPDDRKIHDSPSNNRVNSLAGLKTSYSTQSIFSLQPTWVFTLIGEVSGKKEMVAKVEKLVTILGSKLSRNFNFLTTHVIIEKVPDEKYRFVEFYEAIASKRVVLSIEWVNKSLEQNTVLPLEPYLVASSSKTQVQGQAHETPSQPEESIFKHFQICFIGDFKFFTKGDLIRLVEICGGEYVSDPSLFVIGSQLSQIIVLDKEKLKMCRDPQFLRALKSAQRFSIVNINWLLDSITLGCIQQLCDYSCDTSTTSS